MQFPRLSLLLTASLLAACASTELTSEWRDEGYTGGRLSKLVVIGVGIDGRVRRLVEDEFVARLQDRGSEAIASYRLFPSEDKMSRAVVEEKVRELEAQAILVTRLLSHETETVEYPGSTRIEEYPTGGRWHRYYARSWEVTHTPPRSVRYDIATLESELYDARTDRLLWAATFRTTVDESENRNQAVASFVAQALKSLRKNALIE